MARKSLDKRLVPGILTECRASDHPTAIAFEGGDARRKMDARTAEVILLKIASGMLQKEAALSMGINPGTVAQRSLDDPDGFGVRLREAKELGAETLADSVLEYAMRLDLSARDREVIIDALKWTAKMQNSRVYGDKVAVEAQIGIAPVVLPNVALPSIPDAEFSDVDGDKSE